MAKKGFIYETQIAAKDVDALNRFAVASVDVDGGTLVALGAKTDDVFAATKATNGEDGGLWMAYNPSEHLTKIGDNIYAGEELNVDPREYTNLANRTFDVFKPQVGDLIGFTAPNIKASDISSVAVDKYLEIGADGLEVKASATADTTSFKVVGIEDIPFPTAGIGYEVAKKYVAECVFN